MLQATGAQPIESPLIRRASEAAGVRHGFFTRRGGVSQGIYEGLNVGFGSNDRRGDVEENRARVARFFGLGADRLATLHQVHSTEVLVVDAGSAGTRPKADALVTAEPGIILGVLTADCGPILFADPEARVVGAAHAGWRGAFEGIVETTVAAMTRLGAERSRIVACLGPSISGRAYEVGPEFVERFVARDRAFARYFEPSEKPGHAMFDLPAFTMQRLRDAGVAAENLDLCTYADPDSFFSYRRTTHRGEPDYGRQISVIALV
ncbi:MAG: peptidoglycan editing factor PgeF [Pararhizobium sp.]